MRKVLIVDDEALLRRGLIEMFDWEEQGYTVTGQAANGAEALRLVENDVPHVVIADVRMPVMDGVALTECLQREFPDVAVIILSSFNDFDYVRQTLLLGAVDYILKPRLSRDILLKALKSTEARSALGTPNPNVSFYADLPEPPNALTVFIQELPGFDLEVARDFAERTHFGGTIRYLQGCVVGALSIRRLPTASVIREAHAKVFQLLFLHAPWLGAEKEAERLCRHGMDQLCSAADYECMTSSFAKLTCEAISFFEDSLRAYAGKVLFPVWRYLWEHYDMELNLTGVSNHFFMNKSYLCQLFSRHCHTNSGSLLNDIRIYKAKQLLQNPDISVQTVAQRVGYANPGYFSKQFRSLTGTSPSKYQLECASMKSADARNDIHIL